MRALLVPLLAGLLVAGIARGAGVESFSPRGEAKAVRQATAVFEAPMVAFGDPRLADPFEVQCPVPGAGRWVDARRWVWDFERDLPGGVRCRFSLREGLATLEGEAVAAASFEFDTGGPAVRESLPWEGDEAIDENQAFILGLDAPASAESVARHAWCDVAGRPERIPVRVITGGERAAILERRGDFVGRLAESLGAGSDFQRFLRTRDFDRLPLVVLACRTRLPNEAEVKLVWGRGIEAAGGVPTREDQALAFRVRKAFMARFSCERTQPSAGCIPVLPLRVEFTAPVALALAERVELRGPKGVVVRPKLSPQERSAGFVDALEFPAPLAEETAWQLVLPASMTDDAGRPLTNAARFPLAVRTDAAPPLAKFAARFGILELNAEPALPITLRNVERALAGRRAGRAAQGAALEARALRVDSPREIVSWLARVEAAQARWDPGEEVEAPADAQGEPQPPQRRGAGYTTTSVFRDGDRTTRFTLPKPGAERDFEVVGIPLRAPGLHVVEVVSPRLGQALLKDGQPYHVSAAALVTNLAVHFKHGRESSLAWVTSLDRGEPVAGAEVNVQDCAGKSFFRGRTGADGVLRVRRALPPVESLPGCLQPYDRQFFVSARLGADTSFTLSGWNEGIALWRFNVPRAPWGGPELFHTVFDRTLVRAGETVGMKHFMRRHTAGGFALPPEGRRPVRVVIRHAGSDQTWELPLRWDAAGIAEGRWAVPRDAKTGTYTVTLASRRRGEGERWVEGAESGQFRVEEFRIPVLRARIAGPAEPPVNAAAVDLGVQLTYLSGGGAGHQRVKVRAALQPAAIAFPGYEGIAFANGGVAEGRSEAAPPWWQPPVDEEGERVPASLAGQEGTVPLRAREATLDAGGAATVRIDGLPAADQLRELVAEVEYADPNGQILTRGTRVRLLPSALLLGVKPDGWVLTKDRLRATVLAVDPAGRPQAGVEVAVEVFVRENFSHRKRLIGGFYAYESFTETRRAGELCRGRTDAQGRLPCEAPAPATGNLVLRARAADASGNVSMANAEAWVAGEGDWWFGGSDDDRMDLLPERRRYEPGETALLQVRAPFRRASALVTVEREGVLDAFVVPIEGREPVVRVPLKGHYAPNAFVSVLAVRGRLDDPKPTALVDLARPAFRMGIAELAVGWRAHELKVRVLPEREAFRVRERARVAIEVTRADGSPLPKGTEVAVAAVDEALLELQPNTSWELLEAMMQRRGIEVSTATSVMQVVGKRHFGRKAVPAGGGGGRQTSRELFDTLLAWKPRLVLDAAGRGEIEIPLNDSLSAFRVVAVASGGTGLFGTGRASLRTVQDLALLPGLPPMVREGDRFRATVTVRNAAHRAMEVELTAAVSARPAAAVPAPEPRRVSLAPGEARDLGWDVFVPPGVTALDWALSARETGGEAGDAVKVAQKVVAAVPVGVLQAALLQLDAPATVAVARPADALPGRGGVTVQLRARLSDELSGVREWMERYPYTCLEQRASRAVALRDAGQWAAVMAALPAHLDRDGLAKYFALMEEGSDTLTAFLLSVAQEAGWEIPEPARERMLRGLERFVAGEVVRQGSLPTADLAIRKVAALDALTRHREALEPRLADSFDVQPGLWPTSAVIDWLGATSRWGALPQREQRRAEAVRVLRARLNLQGTTLGFSTERSDYLWWLMVSADVNANRALLALMDDPAWREDMPRMLRGAVGRQDRGAWSTTVANAWGVLALERFGAAFEADPVAGVTTGRLADRAGRVDWSQVTRKGGSIELDWPKDGVGELGLAHEGGGRPWAVVQSRAAVPLKASLSAGFTIRRSVAGLDGASPAAPRRGDVLRVTLELESQGDMSWVVLDDPIPAGATILGSGMGGDSALLAGREKRRGWVWPAFEERTFASFIAYWRFVPKGRWTIEYTLRLNNPGSFELPPTRVEAMYAPEMFAASPNRRLSVGE
jgi:uncharacterized protein YfaS (alpha-2-macroglobulin family)